MSNGVPLTQLALWASTENSGLLCKLIQELSQPQGGCEQMFIHQNSPVILGKEASRGIPLAALRACSALEHRYPSPRNKSQVGGAVMVSLGLC